MSSMGPDTLLVTQDLRVLEIVSLVVPEEEITWRQTYTSALTEIAPHVTTLLVDADTGMAMAYLLASLFLDQKPGRRSVVIESAHPTVRASADARIQVVERPLTPRTLRVALAEAESFAVACQEIEALACGARMVSAVASMPAVC